MESHRCVSASSDHSDTMTNNHEHCSQIPQQMIFSTPPQGHPHHLSGHCHVLSPQSRMVVPQQYVTPEQNMHYGQVQRTLADHPAVCSALTGEISVRGQLTSSVQPNMQTYSDVKCHQRYSNSHEPAPMYSDMSAMSGQVHHSPKAMHQNVEGMTVSGHIPGGDGYMLHGGYYPVRHRGQHMQNSGQISWQSQRHYMSPGGQSALPGQVSGVQTRFSNQVSVPFRGQHPQYALNQEYGDVYCQQYHPMYGELSSGSPRGTFPVQQHCVGPNGQRIMFARHAMHAPHRHPHMPSDAQFVCYVPHSGSGAGQQLSPSWSGSTQMMRSSVPVGYGNQQAWQRPVAVAYGSPLPGQRMPDYHLSPEPRMTAEFCDNFGGARQHSSPSHSFSPGSVRYYRPSSNPGVHTSMMYVDEKYAGACHHVLADGNANSTSSTSNCQEYVSPVLTSTNVSTATMCSAPGSVISSKDSTVLTCTTTPSHPLEHLPDGRTSLSNNACVGGAAASSQSSYNHAGYYLHGANVNGSWPVSAAGEYCSYNTASQYAQHHQHPGGHVNPYNYYASPPPGPYSGTPHYPLARCCHPYQSHADGMHWQGQVAEHHLHECRNVLPNKVASQHHVQQEPLTTIASCGSVSITCSALNVSSPVLLASSPATSWKVDKQNLDNTDEVNIARTVPLQSSATDTDHHVPFSGSAHPVISHSSPCCSLNCSPVSQAVITASAMDSASVVPLPDVTVPPMNNDMMLVRDKNMENLVADVPITESQNCLQITSSTLSSTCKSSKGVKRSGSRKRTTKTKKKKANLPLDTDQFYIDGVLVTCADAVKCDAVRSLYSAPDNISTATPVKAAPGAESVDQLCPVTSNCSEQTAVVVPYGWRRHINSGTVVYYRFHSFILFIVMFLGSVRLLVLVFFKRLQGLKWGRVSRVGDPALIYLPLICRVYTGSLVFTALARIITAILQINEGVMGKNEVT